MFIACVTIYVNPDDKDKFILATTENAKNSRKEPDNLRFDFLQCLDDSNRFFLYEVYTDENGMNKHKETAHYNKWRETVETMMAKAREGIKHRNLFPNESEAFLST
ncbi:MAG: putative quinol monooxygenase [Candidatus Hodarchaeales archaeon]|jgi:autoinducer 2-degrading protein